jgi:dTDP-4-amino-4,6-dideoxygalactose transaminase
MQFRDLKKQYEVLKKDIDEKVQRVCSSAHYIGGAEVEELEKELAEYVGVKHCVTCGNGTDAITLAFKAWGLGVGDAVFVPDFTFFSSGECPALEGCTCIFVDVDWQTFNINPIKLEEAINKVIELGEYKPKAVVAVDLFGLPANYQMLRDVCDKYHLLLLEDGAQGFGGNINGKKACSFGDISTTSFFPAKPLGCYGDGGAVFTNNDEWAALIRSYAVHGKAGNDKYNNIRLGLNSRLDTIQAAVLQVKLKVFKDYELDDVNRVADWYGDMLYGLGLDKVLEVPIVPKGFTSSWAQYTVKLPKTCYRAELQEAMKNKDIPTMVYYMKPMHLQGAFDLMVCKVTDCSVTEDLSKRVLSLPIHPYMSKSDVEKVALALAEYSRAKGLLS